jgi:hypothetical protein
VESGEWRVESGELSTFNSPFSTFFSIFNFQLSIFNYFFRISDSSGHAGFAEEDTKRNLVCLVPAIYFDQAYR